MRRTLDSYIDVFVRLLPMIVYIFCLQRYTDQGKEQFLAAHTETCSRDPPRAAVVAGGHTAAKCESHCHDCSKKQPCRTHEQAQDSCESTTEDEGELSISQSAGSDDDEKVVLDVSVESLVF